MMKKDILLGKIATKKTLSDIVSESKKTHQSERVIAELFRDISVKSQNLSQRADSLKSMFFDRNEPFGTIPLDEEFSKYLLSLGRVVCLDEDEASYTKSIFSFESFGPVIRATKETQTHAVLEVLKSDLQELKHKAPNSIRYAVCKAAALYILTNALGTLGHSIKRSLNSASASVQKIQQSNLVGLNCHEPLTLSFKKEDFAETQEDDNFGPLDPSHSDSIKSPEELEKLSILNFIRTSVEGDLLKPITRLFLLEEYFLESKDSFDFIVKALELYQKILALTVKSFSASNSSARFKLLCTCNQFIELFGRLELFNLTTEYLPSDIAAFHSPVNSRTEIGKFRYESTTKPTSFDFKKYSKFSIGLQSSEFRLSILPDSFILKKETELDCFESRLSLSCPESCFSILDSSFSLCFYSNQSHDFHSNSKNYSNLDFSLSLNAKIVTFKNKNIIRITFFDELDPESNLTLKSIKSLKGSSAFTMTPVGFFNSKKSLSFTSFKDLYEYLSSNKFRVSKQGGFSYGFTVSGPLGKFRVSYND